MDIVLQKRSSFQVQNIIGNFENKKYFRRSVFSFPGSGMFCYYFFLLENKSGNLFNYRGIFDFFRFAIQLVKDISEK